MNDTNRNNEKEKAPFYLLLTCLIGALGVVAVFAGYFTHFHPLLQPAGWGCFLGANGILMLHAIFRKKRSDVAGAFHAYNLVSWMVSTMIVIAIGLVFAVVLFAVSRFSDASPGKFRGTAQFWAGCYAGLIAYGWFRWFLSIRKKTKS